MNRREIYRPAAAAARFITGTELIFTACTRSPFASFSNSAPLRTAEAHLSQSTT
jgi:hypothetical protein